MSRPSLRLRLALVFTAAMAAMLVAIGAFLYLRLRSELLESVDMSLRARAQTIAQSIEAGASIGDPNDPTDTPGTWIDPDEALAQVVDATGRVIDATAGVTEEPLVSSARLAGVSPPLFFERSITSLDTEDAYRLLVVPVERADEPVYVIVGATLSDPHEALHHLLLLLLIGGPVALVLTSLGGWVLAGAALRPVERMRQEAEAISVSEPERRLPVPAGDDEIARLGSTLNTMLDRLQASFDRERRFVDEASHELRTPLAVLKVELDLALARDRSALELMDSLRSASRETDRLVRLAEDLLVLARSDGGKLPIRRLDTSIDELLRATADAWGPRAEGAEAHVDVHEGEAGRASVDPTRLRQVLDNLIENALRHGAATQVTLAARRTDHELTLSVSDNGTGFAPGETGWAFQPFLGTGTGEGPGLGLAVVKAVAEAHGGSVSIEDAADDISEDRQAGGPTGASVVVRLPLG